VNPGGSGDIYAGLNAEERAALTEATRMGYPPRAWYNHESLHNGYFSDVFGILPMIDFTYEADFWSKPGYLGSDPKADIHADRFQFETTVARVIEGPPLQAVLAHVPDKDLGCAHLTVLSGEAESCWFHIAAADGKTVAFASTSDAGMLGKLRAGDRVRIDNSWILAAQTYHRHQVPPSTEEYGWNQFRDAQGKPVYPQRDVLIGHNFALNSVGSLLTGRIHGKMLLVQAMMDIDALAWCGDWYRAEVKKALGAGFADDFALWFIDHAQHDLPKTAIQKAHTVGLDGPLQQGLRDLARWVEAGARPSDTAYEVNDAQVELPAEANARKGIQPVAQLKANGAERAEVRVGEAVNFASTIEVPQGAGKVVAAEWDFEGAGSYGDAEDVGTPQPRISIAATHSYAKPGTYYPVLRATAHREGDAKSPYARVQNLARVRVVVK
jgi:hypothetical protein